MPAKKVKPRRGRRKGSKKNSKALSTLLGFGFLVVSGAFFFSFTNHGALMTELHQELTTNFGSLGWLFPLVILFFGFLFLRLKFILSELHVAVGFLVIYVSLLGFFRTGAMGTQLFTVMKEMLTTPGADLVFIAGFWVGAIVFFNTSMDEVMTGISTALGNSHRLVPTKGLSLRQNADTIPGLNRGKPMMIKGGQKDTMPAVSPVKTAVPAPVVSSPKKNGDGLSDKLVANVLENASNGIWEYPPLSLLSEAPGAKADRGDIKKIASVIERTLQSFGVDAHVVEVNLGPAVTQYALEIALGTKVSKITALANDLALATEAPTGQIRIEAPIPGRNLVGIEIPNRSLEVVTLRTMLASTAMQKSRSKLSVSMGLDVSGNPIVVDIAKMPHVLVAGTTGSGKSVLVTSFISSLLFRASPSEVKLILVDPKRVEFTAYNGIPHLLTPVIVEVEKILSALKWATGEMDRRYKLFAERGVRNIEGYNELSGFQAMPYIVIIIDELADLMMFAPVEVEDTIARIAQMARAVGIHLVIATQRPSVNVITGLIKANVPTRIAFNVSSMIDSRVILDAPGAEKLLGRGDMLYIPPDQAKPTRIQGAFVSEKEVKNLVDFMKAKNMPVEYTEEILTQQVGNGRGGKAGASGGSDRDPMFEDVVRLVCQFDTASASFLQRKMSIGYSRAARILDQLEEMGIVGHAEGSKPRDVLVRNADEFLQNMQQQ